MTEHIESDDSQQPVPSWVFPPPQGFAADDLDNLPQLPAHTELIDGSLVFVSPQRDFHGLAMYLLESELRRSRPAEFTVRREMSVILGPRQRPEPDVIVLRADAPRGLDDTAYEAKDVLLAIEVVSPDSETRDRERKPRLYAEAGIPHFWLVEHQSGQTVVYVYELELVNKTYVATGVHHDRLKLTVPFDIDIDFTEIDRL